MRRNIVRTRRRGQALVEFALVAPLLLVLMVGILEAGRLIYYYHLLNDAAREGSRFAIVHGENAFDGCPSGPVPTGVSPCDTAGDNIRARITDIAQGLDLSGLSFGWPGDASFPLYSARDGSDDPYNRVGNNVSIHLEYAYEPIVLLGLIGTINIQAESTLVINN